MRYQSTRDPTSAEINFEQAVMAGLATDGGLYVPVQIPKLVPDFLTKWSSFSYTELAFAIFRPFIDQAEIADADLRQLIDKSYRQFDTPEVTPVRPLTTADKRVFLLELWHGPTFAFKDVALQFLGNLFEFFLERRNHLLEKKSGLAKLFSRRKPASGEQHRLTILGATSGDTGSAAIYGLRGKKNIQCYILHPRGRVSAIQCAQMTTVLDSNIHNIAVEGTFDDCQELVKVLFRDTDFNQKHHLGAINSINWARILAQIVYYFYSYFSVCKQLGLQAQERPPIQYSIPTGNFGDALAGFYAKQLGLPIDRLIIATNANDILVRFFDQGVYERQQVHSTLSPAMDIQISSNFERFLYHIALMSQDPNEQHKAQAAAKQILDWMSELSQSGAIRSFKPEHLKLARSFCSALRVSDQETLETIRKFRPNDKETPLDPHTAVGVRAVEQLCSETACASICLATAHCAKFLSAVYHGMSGDLAHPFTPDPTLEGKLLDGSIKHSIPIPHAFEKIMKRPSRCIHSEASVDALKSIIEHQ